MDKINKLSIKFTNDNQITISSKPGLVLYSTNPTGTNKNVLHYFINIYSRTKFRVRPLTRLIKRFGDFDWYE